MHGVSARFLLVLSATVALTSASIAQDRAPMSGPDRSSPPLPGPPPALILPPLHTFTLANGLRVWVAEMPEVPVAEVRFVVECGAADDPPERPGLASMTAAMLSEGAGRRDAETLADDISFLGATLEASTSYDATQIQVSVPVARLDEALAIAADVLTAPALPAESLERLRRERLTRLLQIQDDPSSLASTALTAVLYGPDHPYGRPVFGTRASVEAMTLAEVRRFHGARYAPARTQVIVAGAVTPDETRAALERALGTWTALAPAASTAVPDPGSSPPGVYLIDRPGAPQAEIRVGRIGVPRQTPDRFALDVLNTVLGGSFMSRLNMNLREEHGYAYGAGSYFDMRLGRGPFVVWAAVDVDRAADALTEIMTELANIRNPIPPDEVARGRGFAALGFPAGFETPADLTRRLAEQAIYQLPDTFFEDYVPAVERITPDEVRQAAERYLPVGEFAAVVVGDLAVIEPAIRASVPGGVRVLQAADIFR